MIIEVIGWLGFVFILLGYYLNAKQNINCFYIWGLGNILFVLGMNVYGYKSWRKNG